MLQWEGGRRLYLFAMTENIKVLLRRWQRELFPDDLKREKGIVERDVFSAATLYELDDAYAKKMHGFENVDEFYAMCSCANYFDGVTVPMVFINSEDDPIVPPPLLAVVKEACKKRENFLYVEQKFGGHLGFYEGGYLIPNPTTWLDKAVVSLADSLAVFAADGKDKKAIAADDDGIADAAFDKEFTPASDSGSSSGADDHDDDFVAGLLNNGRSKNGTNGSNKRLYGGGGGGGVRYVCKRRKVVSCKTHFSNVRSMAI